MSSAVGKAVFHSGSYLVMQVVSRLVGLASFPIITRLLTVQEYGLLALANATLLFLYAIGKCGVPRALITAIAEHPLSSSHRLYWEGIVTVLVATASLCAVYLLFLPAVNLVFPVPFLFYLLPPIVIARNAFAVHQAWLRAVERILNHNLLSISFTVVSTVASIAALFYIAPTVNAMFGAKLLIESAIVCIILAVYYVRTHFDASLIEIKTIKSLLKFGFPLVWLELSMIVLTFGDRYQIGFLLDAGAVGVYSAAYNLAQYVQQMISQPLVMAAYPIYNKLYTEKGKGETTAFLNKIINYYFMVAVPILVFVSFHAREILSVLASEKYAAAAGIVPVVLLGNLLNGCVPLISAGLYLSKKTKYIGRITVLCAGINFTLNWLFIILFGYAGAAVTTLISFFVLFFMIKREADELLPVNLSFFRLGNFFLMSLLAMMPLLLIHNNSIPFLLLRGVAFFVFYIVLTSVSDKDIMIDLKNMYNYLH